MMNTYLKMIAISSAVLLSSCDQLLEVKPRAANSAETARSTLAGVQASLNATYGGMRGGTGGNYYGRNMIMVPELLADNVRLTNLPAGSGRGTGFITNDPGNHIAIWGTGYGVINNANLVIQAADNITDASPAEKASIKAQAMFLRALLHFDLARVYAYTPGAVQHGFNLGIPLLLAPVDDFTTVTYPARSPVADVYKQIETDLLEAVTLFTAGETVSTAYPAPFYASKGAAEALLARLYLYWAGPADVALLEKAAAAAAAAIVSSGKSLVSNAAYTTSWAAPTKAESIFEINYHTMAEALSGDNSLQGWYQYRASPRAGWGDVVASPDLLAAYEPNDVRRSVYLQITRTDGEVVQQTNKFQGSKGAFGWDNIPVIRISEVYLSRAEAYARLGKTDLAQADLTLIRRRAGIADISPAGQALVEAVLQERRLELAFEGHRFFDLKRLGRDISKSPGTAVPITDYRILPSIPLADIQVNANLKQNPNY